MALKGDRLELLTDLSFFMNATGQRGIIVVHNTGGSGVSMDDANATVVIPSTAQHITDPSGDPAGLLLNDVVNIDLTRQRLNEHKDEVQQGGKVLLLRRGTVVTDRVSGTVSAGEAAHYVLTGHLVGGDTNSTSTKVGRFLSATDADGYAKVDINIV